MKRHFLNWLIRFLARIDRTFLERLIINIFMMNGGEDMLAMLYAQAIINGKRTIRQVPARLKPAVKEILIDSGCPELAEEPDE